MRRNTSLRPGAPGRADALRIAAALVALVALAWLVRTQYHQVEVWLGGLGHWAPAAFLLVHAVLVTLGFPVSVLGVLAGATFGWLGATGLLLLAALVAASIMYGLGRTLLAGPARRAIARRPRLLRLMVMVDRDALRLMVLLRLSPLHFALVSYLLGTGRVPFAAYLLTTLLVLPSAAFQAYVGHAARVVGEEVALTGAIATGRLIYLGAGLLATAALAVLLGRMARRALEADTESVEREPS